MLVYLSMSEWLPYIRLEPLTYFFQAITFSANEVVIAILLPVLYWCWKKRAGVHLMMLAIITAYINLVLKGIFAWERPPMDLWLVDASGYSFPSAHAMYIALIGGYLAFAVRKKWFTIAVIIYLVLVSLSRVYLGVHYLQDVVAGVALGAIILLLYRFVMKWTYDKLVRVHEVVKGAAFVLLSILLLAIKADVMIATLMGLFAGIGVGFLMEPHFAEFKVGHYWYFKILRVVSGTLVLLGIWQGLEWILPMTISFTWFEYFIIGVWISVGAPWMFVQMRIAKREHD